MNKDNVLEIRKKATILVRMIQDEICVNPRSIDKKRMTCKFNSSIFKKKIEDATGKEIPDKDWVAILKFLRESPKFSAFYNLTLNVPFEHDGGSFMHFPEVYDGDEKILVRLLTDIFDLSAFYPDVPGINDREWKKGDVVFVPEDRASRYLKIKWIEEIEN